MDADDETGGRVSPEAALSRQISIGDFRRRIRPSAAVIREQKQWNSSPPWWASKQYRIYSDNASRTPVRHAAARRGSSRRSCANSGATRWRRGSGAPASSELSQGPRSDASGPGRRPPRRHGRAADRGAHRGVRQQAPGLMHACGHDIHTTTLLGSPRRTRGRNLPAPSSWCSSRPRKVSAACARCWRTG